ncbi:uncharacterized protein LOC114129349 [Aphis gossypii]|uniref:uncharacterized protein LOC114129349 n=1 Tax=Aphis gossypii TaxID=80765 RepID=UPI002158C1DA|nr:uncharacterized protein LOC114129349 [Aphis gossypii]
MEKKTIIYNFGPDGRDACWAALTSSWSHFSKQQGLNTTQVSCDSSACSDVEAQFKDTTRTLNLWPVKSRGRPNKKKKQNFLTTTTTSLSPPPQPLPPSSPRTLKRRSDVLQQQWLSVNYQLSSSAEVVKQKISEPPKVNGPCNCSQSVNSELSGVIVTSNINNNNNDDDVVDNDKNKYGAMETIDFADRKQQQLMLCAADSGSWTDVNGPVAVDVAEQPIELPNEDDHVSSVSHPPTPPTAVVEQPIEHARQIENHRVASTEFRPPTPFAVIEQPPIERALPNGDDDHDVSADLCQLTPFAVIEQPIERALPNGDDDHDVSADLCQLTPFAVIEQPIERALQPNGDDDHDVSADLCQLTPFAVSEQPIERALPNGDDDHDVSADLHPPTPFAVAENPTMMEVDVSYREVVSPTFRPQLSLMTSTTDADNPTAITIVSPSSSQSQPNDGKDCPVKSNSSMIVFSEKPLSKYEMKIKEIDNSIISYSKSFLSTVLFVVLLRVLF